MLQLYLIIENGEIVMTNKYDVIVVGAGSMGMAAGYYLAEQGKRLYSLMHLIHHMKMEVIVATHV